MRFSLQAGRSTKPAKAEDCIRRVGILLLSCAASCISMVVPNARAQSVAPPVTAPDPAAQTAKKPDSAELASHDEPATFKVNVKLVVVRAVVRDAQGNAVGNLRQQDFQIFDKGKPQTITQFEVEQPGALAAKVRQRSAEQAAESAVISAAGNSPSSAIPERYIAYMFDDVHLAFGDLAQVRQAAERHFATLRPTDRAAIFTTSGVMPLDFTDDRAKLHEALNRLQPRSIIGTSAIQECPDITFYQADLIINRNDPQALSVALLEALACQKQNNPSVAASSAASASVMQAMQNAAMQTVQGRSAEVLGINQHESHVSLGSLSDVVRRISAMPGQRSIVLVSPGFLTPQMEFDYNQIVDRALRSQVVINTLDARGLYVPAQFADASQSSFGVVSAGPAALGVKALLISAASSAQDEVLQFLAEGTGGSFFHNSNDFDEGFRRVAEAPQYSYVLAFAPQNLKLDGNFHNLTVKLNSPQKLTVQARQGYFAPKNYASPEEQAKQEIEDEMFSQEELHQLPVKLHTQFFKASDNGAKIIVLAHVDVQRLRFRKTEGRNNNVLTCVSALFDRDGSFVQGSQKIVTMHWKDETLQHKLSSGITLKTSFDVKPGNYLVRLVVRDSEAQVMSAENGAVEIR
jgi:VWFA-related protein